LGVKVRWLGKDSLFTSWRRPVMRALGGISVDRSAPDRVVADVVRQIRDGTVFALVVTPDGTRKGHSHWKSGFYRIARETGMPVTLGYVDSTTMTTGLGPTMELTGDVAGDMDRIRAFYADKSGYLPEHRVEPRLRDETGQLGGRTGRWHRSLSASGPRAAPAGEPFAESDGEAGVDRGSSVHQAGQEMRTCGTLAAWMICTWLRGPGRLAVCGCRPGS